MDLNGKYAGGYHGQVKFINLDKPLKFLFKMNSEDWPRQLIILKIVLDITNVAYIKVYEKVSYIMKLKY